MEQCTIKELAEENLQTEMKFYRIIQGSKEVEEGRKSIKNRIKRNERSKKIDSIPKSKYK
jgi:hypothetical protein